MLVSVTSPTNSIVHLHTKKGSCIYILLQIKRLHADTVESFVKKVHYISMAAANPTQRSGDNQKKTYLERQNSRFLYILYRRLQRQFDLWRADVKCLLSMYCYWLAFRDNPRQYFFFEH